jgi:hypothetical protein
MIALLLVLLSGFVALAAGAFVLTLAVATILIAAAAAAAALGAAGTFVGSVVRSAQRWERSYRPRPH